MAVATYDVGDVVRLEGSFSIDGVATDPSTVTVKVQKPDGTDETIAGGSVTNPSVGLWRTDYTPASWGVYYYRFEGTGAAKAAGEGTFRVRQSNF